jgi:hypothetical protein
MHVGSRRGRARHGVCGWCVPRHDCGRRRRSGSRRAVSRDGPGRDCISVRPRHGQLTDRHGQEPWVRRLPVASSRAGSGDRKPRLLHPCRSRPGVARICLGEWLRLGLRRRGSFDRLGAYRRLRGRSGRLGRRRRGRDLLRRGGGRNGGLRRLRSGSRSGSGSGRRVRRRLTPRLAPARGEKRKGVQVAVRIGGRPDTQVDRGDGLLGRPGGTDRSNRLPLAHGGASGHGHGPQVDERDRVAVVGLDRHGEPVRSDRTSEGDAARPRRDHRGTGLPADVDAAVLAGRVRIASVVKRLQQRPGGRPRPRTCPGGEHEEDERHGGGRSRK